MPKMLFSTHLLQRTARAVLPSLTSPDPQLERGIDALLEATAGLDGISHEHIVKVDDRPVCCSTHALNLAAPEVAALCCSPERQDEVERRRLEMAIRATAARRDVDVVTLGALTPGLVRNGLSLRDLQQADGNPIAITTGSALTAHAAVQAALTDPVHSPSDHRFAVLGAFGSVGAMCWQLLAEATVRASGCRPKWRSTEAAVPVGVGGLTLLYRPGPDALKMTASRLKSVLKRWETTEALAPAARLFEQQAGCRCEPAAVVDAFASALDKMVGIPGWMKFAAAADPHALNTVDRLLVATNQAGGLDLSDVSSEAHIYDIGQPLSFDHEAMTRRGCTVHRAGLVRFPRPLRFSFTDVADLPESTSLGCFAEGVLLAAFDPAAAPKRARIELAEVARLAELARRAGLEPTLA